MKNIARQPSVLSKSLDALLNGYALAASAAGVGVLALVQPSEAKIVYTPTHKVITLHHPYVMDVNHDGLGDFRLVVSSQTNGGKHGLFLICSAFNNSSHGGGNSVAGSYSASFTRLDYALKKGTKIDHSQFQTFVLSQGVMASHRSGKWHGHWVNVQNLYLGFQFLTKAGDLDFGWARLSVKTTKGSVTAMLTGYAYETIPNKPIIAGKTKGPDVITLEPGSLGALAAGRSRLHRQQ